MSALRLSFDGGGTVTSLEATPYALPFSSPYVTSRGTLYRREAILVRVRTSEGLVGLGEAVPLSLRGGDPIAQVHTELLRIAAWLEKCEGHPQAGASVLAGLVKDSSAPTRCAVLTAWLDLAGKVENAPAWKLLGAEEAAPVRCNATIPGGPPLAVAERALEWAADGFVTFKLKVGEREDVAAVLMVREAVGSDARIRVDANGAWNPEEAFLQLTAMAGDEGGGLEFAEQPCGSLEEMAELRKSTDIRIAADESISDTSDARRAIDLGACEYMTAKLSKVGGPFEALALSHAIPTYLSSALDGPVGIAAAAHAAPGVPNPEDVAHGLATQRLFSSTIASRQCELRGDMLHLPEGPGLGVEIDDAALEAHRL
jgi:o-succinylbenzoate synthase